MGGGGGGAGTDRDRERHRQRVIKIYHLKQGTKEKSCALRQNSLNTAEYQYYAKNTPKSLNPGIKLRALYLSKNWLDISLKSASSFDCSKH